MDTALLDAAFRLVSHSITTIEAQFHPFTTDEARLAQLRSQFPELDAQALNSTGADPWCSMPPERVR
jgi:hypothetical protein